MAGARIRVTVIRPKGADVDTEQLRRDFTKMLRNTAADGQRLMATYPPQTLTKTGYVRTRTLGRSWSHKVTSTSNKLESIVGSNDNIAPYNKIVQGKEEDQSAMFRGAGWKGVDELSKFLQDRVDREAQRIMDRFAR